MIRTSRLFCVPLIAILGLVFSVNIANAAIIAEQSNFSASEAFHQSFGEPFYFQANVQQAIPAGTTGTVKTIYLYGSSVTKFFYSIQLIKSIGSIATSFSGTTTPIAGLVAFTPTFGGSVTIDPNSSYGIQLGGANGAPATAWFGADIPTIQDVGTSIMDWNNQSIASTSFPTINGMYSLFFRISDASPPVILFDIDLALISPCPIFGVDICSGFGKVISWAFVPSQESFDRFVSLKDDLKNKAPFGYFTSAAGAISDISATSSPAFALGTSTPIMTHIFNPLRAGIVWLIYFAAIFWIYKRVTRITI